MPVSCWMTPIGVADDVRYQMNRVNGIVDETVEAVFDVTQDLINYQVPGLAVAINLPAIEDFAPLEPETPPDFNNIGIDVLPGFPTAPNDSAPGVIVRPAGPPSPPSEAPTPNIPVAPYIYDPNFTTPPTVSFPDAPIFGSVTAGIPVPTLREIVLPDPPDINLDGIIFNSPRPVFTEQPPDANDFVYVDEPYEQIILPEVKAVVQRMLNGQSGLPLAVEDAIWAREAEREDAQQQRAEREATVGMAARGFSLPNGILLGLLEAARQNGQNQRNTLGRDTMINIHKVLIDQLKEAVAQGIAMEQLWVQLYTSTQDRKLQAARIAVDIAISVFNAKVALFQAEGEMYRIDAEVYKARIEAELAKLQVYSEQIKAQALIGDLNEQDIRIYTARLQAVDTDVRIFIGLNEARKTTIEAELAKLTAFRATIDIELAKLQASEQRLEAWKTTLSGEQLVQEAYRTRTQGYLTAVQAWQTEYQAEIERFKGGLELMDSNTQRYAALINGYTAFANYQKSRADILVADNTSKVQLYTALTQGTTSFNQVMLERVRLINEALRSQTELALKNGDINVTNAIQGQQLMIRSRETAAQVLASVGGSALAAANVNASISDSTNASGSCSTSITSIVD